MAIAGWLLLIVAVGIIGLILFSVRYYNTEGFADILSVETPFVDSQSDNYANIMKTVITNPGVDNMTSALTTPDIFLPFPIGNDALMAKRLIPDKTNRYTDYDNKFCRGALQPANLPRHIKGARDGCGWWYVADATLTSTGVLGTIDGPLFTDGLANGGQWIWDLKKAQELEEIKMCKQVTACEVIDTNNIHNRCGFCPTAGYAVPIRTDGSEKYPTNPLGSCGTDLVLDGNKCPSENVYKPVVAIDGTDCKNYGYPSPDGSIRLYNKEDCDAINGNWVPNGECLMLHGGSYSAACAGLNRPVKEPSTCTSNNGRITTACLLLLAKSLGYKDTGAILRILKDGGQMNDNDRAAFAQLNNVGVSVPAGILKGGELIDRNTAANYYMRIKEQIRIGIHSRVRNAAQWCVSGTPDFSPCDFESGEKGPFPTSCLQQQWRTVGCQPAGTGYPTDDNAGEYDTMIWGDIINKFQAKYDSMNSTNAGGGQDSSIKQCLGIDVARKVLPSCSVELPTFYSDYNYKGKGVVLDVGQYPFTKFIQKIANDSISSIRVPAGYTVTAFQDDIGSRSYTYTANNPDLRSTPGFNKMISALIIRKT
jgi:hypothetical protein